MKSAMLVSYQPGLALRCVKALAAAGAQHRLDEGGWAQLEGPSGRLFTLEAATPADLADWRDSIAPATPGLHPPNLDLLVSTAYVECRWEDFFARTTAYLADQLGDQLWVLDSHGLAWDARAVDPARIRL